jgi:sugar phosphate isomerase/epimerase
MKYAFMSFSCTELSLDGLVGAAKMFGYDAIELRLDAQHKHGIEVGTSSKVRAAVKKSVQKGPIPICCLATSCCFADPKTVAKHIEDARARIDLAGDTGVRRIRVFGGGIPEGVSRDEAVACVADALSSLAEQATERGVVICMETHDAWCDPAHVAEVMRRVNHKFVGVNWDIMHPVRSAKVTMEQAFETLKPWIRHVHFHDCLPAEKGLVLCPVGEGIIDHRAAVRLLKAAGYDGYLSGEWIGWEPWDRHLPRELATMKRYEQE